jgi:hypothetical protein
MVKMGDRGEYHKHRALPSPPSMRYLSAVLIYTLKFIFISTEHRLGKVADMFGYLD